MPDDDTGFDLSQDERDHLIERRKEAENPAGEADNEPPDVTKAVKLAASMAAEHVADKVRKDADAANMKAIQARKVKAAQVAIRTTLEEVDNFTQDDFDDVQHAVGRLLSEAKIDGEDLSEEEVTAKVAELTLKACATISEKSKRRVGQSVGKDDVEEFDKRMEGAEASSSSAMKGGGTTPAASKNTEKVDPLKFGGQDRRIDYPTGDELNDRHEARKAEALKAMKV